MIEPRVKAGLFVLTNVKINLHYYLKLYITFVVSVTFTLINGNNCLRFA